MYIVFKGIDIEVELWHGYLDYVRVVGVDDDEAAVEATELARDPLIGVKAQRAEDGFCLAQIQDAGLVESWIWGRADEVAQQALEARR